MSSAVSRKVSVFPSIAFDVYVRSTSHDFCKGSKTSRERGRNWSSRSFRPAMDRGSCSMNSLRDNTRVGSVNCKQPADRRADTTRDLPDIRRGKEPDQPAPKSVRIEELGKLTLRPLRRMLSTLEIELLFQRRIL